MKNWTDLLPGKVQEILEQKSLPGYLPHCRWFGGKSRSIQNVCIQDRILPFETCNWVWLILRVEFTSGLPETYSLPLAQIPSLGMEAEIIRTQNPLAILTELGIGETETLTDSPVLLYEAVYNLEFRNQLVDLITSSRAWPGFSGTLQGSSQSGVNLDPLSKAEQNSYVLSVEQSNTSLIYPGRVFLKILRRLEVGENPELEILRFLKERTDFRHAPPLLGCLEYKAVGQPGFTLAIAQGLVAHEQGAWSHALASANRYIDSLLLHRALLKNLPNSENVLPLEFARLIGRRTAEMHRALASHPEVPGFALIPFSRLDQDQWMQALQTQVTRVLAGLEQVLPTLSPERQSLAHKVLDSRVRILESFAELGRAAIPILTTRVHGDYHLGQVLFTGQDVVILDFEGEPARPLKERILPRSPWRDVAGMIRSFEYAIHSVWPGSRVIGEEPGQSPAQALESWVELWPKSMAKSFLEAYLETAGNSPFVPKPDHQALLLRVHLMEKAVYELEYEMNNRPTWVHIPMLGILNLLSP